MFEVLTITTLLCRHLAKIAPKNRLITFINKLFIEHLLTLKIQTDQTFHANTNLQLPTNFLSVLVTYISLEGFRVKTSSSKNLYYKTLQPRFFVPRYFWGWLTDKIGRRPVLLISASLTYCATLAFGFSTNFYFAVVTRFLQGLFNGKYLVVIIGEEDVAN